jgi:K+/H+ antiporter YhaU regulatory subunit KhtT
MRVVGTLALAAAVGLFLVGLASGQRPGGGFGGFGGGARAIDPGTLIHNPQVQKELKLSEDQVKKVDEAVAKAIGTVLEPEQQKRLDQISMQLKGSKAFTDPKIQTALKFTAEQKDNVKTIIEDSEKEIKELLKEKNKEAFTKLATLRKEADEKVKNVLNESQKKMWTEMIGEEFKLAVGGGFKKGKKNKDA